MATTILEAILKVTPAVVMATTILEAILKVTPAVVMAKFLAAR
jgi:hypothetical protein